MSFIQLHPDLSVHPNERGALVESVDLIAIAGPGPNSFSPLVRATDSFTAHEQGNQNWLRDYIPKAFPHCRILAYDYDILHTFAPRSATSSIHEAAAEFLVALRASRRVDPHRPIIFIAHGLGGLIVKHAIAIASSSRLYRPLKKAVRGVLLFGTPHLERERSSSLESLISRVTKALYLQWPAENTNSNPISRRLILGNAHKPWQWDHTVSVTSLDRKTLKSIKIMEFVEGVNPVSYRRASDPELQPLWDSTTVLNAAHHDLCRFSAPDNPNYLIVQDALLYMLDEILKSDYERRTLDYCEFRLVHELSRYSNYLKLENWSSEEAPSTCGWILAHSSFRAWHLATPGSILWLTGEAGSGKSTLARYVSGSLEAVEADISGSGRQSPPVSSVTPKNVSTRVLTYLCEHSSRSTSAESILRGLLHQLLIEQPTLMNYVPRNFQAECGRGPAEASVLGSTLWHIAENVNVYVVIDALDELDAVTQKTLIAALGGKPNRPRSPEACSLCRRSTIQSSTPRLRLIVTSRDSSLVDPLDPRIDLSAGEARARVLQGVKLFLASGIDSLAQQGNGFSSQALQKVKPWFLSHAHKGFLWATLGLVALKYGMRDPQQTRFQIPESLDALYALLLESSINKFPRLAHNILKTLKWILLAQRPLTVDELAGTFCFKYSELGEIGSVPPSVIRHNHDLAVWEPLNELCGTFIQVVDSKVYFAHRTVRDFLFSSSHSPKTLQKSATHFRPVLNYSEDGLARHCLEYIVSASSDSVLLDRYGDPSAAISLTCRFPFLSYAAVHWFDHAYVAKNSDPKLAMLTDTLSDPKSPWFRAWFPVYWFSQYTEEWQQKKFPIYPTRLVVLALLGSEDGILQVLNDNHALADEFTPAGEEWTPLLAAVWNGHERVMDLLLKFSDTWLESSRTIQAVTYALERGHPSLAKRLLVHYWRTTPTRPTRLLNTGVDDDERDLLMLAIINGYADIVDLLMNNGCNPNPHRFATSQAKSPYVDLALPTSPLGLAAFLGDVKLSMILLENGASVSASHALREAAKSGLEDIIDVLLKYDSSSATVNDEHQIGFGRTPLSYAAASGHAAMVRLLLERGANPELQDSFGWQPLHWAAVSGSIEVFRLLLDQPGLTRRQLTTAFYAACSSAKASVVRLILDNGKFKDSLAKKDILQTATRQIFANQRFVPFSAQGRGAAPVLVTHEHQRLYTLRAILQATRTDHDAAEISLELLPCVSRRQETNTVRYLLRSLDKVSLDNPILGSSFDAAARSGNDGLLRAYIGKGVPIRSSAWRNAAESGCHQAVKTICMAATTGRNHVDPPPYYWLIPQPAASKPQLGEPSLDSGSSSCFSAIPLQYREAAEYLNELHIRPNQRIDFSQEDDLSWTNRFKSFVEDRTGTSWIWYPLGPRLHQLRNGEVWLKWTCDAGTQHRERIPSSLAQQITALRSFHLELLKASGHQNDGDSGIPNDARAPCESTSVSRSRLIVRAMWQYMVRTRGQSHNSPGPPAHQGWLSPASSQSPNSAGHASSTSPRNLLHRRQYPSPQLIGPKQSPPPASGQFVLVKALNCGIVHIDVSQCPTDDLFFEELKKHYKRAKGWFRHTFSIWRYDHCNFDKFTRMRDNLIVSRSKGYEDPEDNYLPPPPHNQDYVFSSVQDMPPIGRKEFRKMHYACRTKCCFWAQFLHTCDAPSGLYSNGSLKGQCTDESLQLIPKRLGSWDVYDNRRGEAWGLSMFESPSVLGVVAYLIVSLLGPIIFFSLWLSLWDQKLDLQNASVPILIVLAFWALIFQWFFHRSSDAS